MAKDEAASALIPLKEGNDGIISLWKDSSTRQKLVLVYLLWGQFAVFLCVGAPNPFLTRVILDKGGLPIESSLLLQITLLAMAISSLLFGKYQVYMDSKCLLLTGLSFFAICQASFGLLHFTSNMKIVVSVGILVRLTQGFGMGAYLVSSLTIICQEFADNISQVFGMSEALLAIGYMCGPVIGGALFSISENTLWPFVISSLFVLPLVPVGHILLKSYCVAVKDKERIHISGFLGKPAPIFIIGLSLMITSGFGLVGVLGSVYLASRGFTVIQIGLGLLTSAGTYAFISFIIGFVIARDEMLRRGLLGVGFIGSVASPAIFSSSQNMTGIFGGMVLFGVFGACTQVCGFCELVSLVVGVDNDEKSNFVLHSALSGIWSLANGVGQFFGPFVGSQLYAMMGYRFSILTCMAAGFCFVVLCSFVAHLYQLTKSERKEYSSLN